MPVKRLDVSLAPPATPARCNPSNVHIPSLRIAPLRVKNPPPRRPSPLFSSRAGTTKSHVRNGLRGRSPGRHQDEQWHANRQTNRQRITQLRIRQAARKTLLGRRSRVHWRQARNAMAIRHRLDGPTTQSARQPIWGTTMEGRGGRVGRRLGASPAAPAAQAAPARAAATAVRVRREGGWWSVLRGLQRALRALPGAARCPLPISLPY